MTGPAEEPVVLEATLAAAVGDRDDVIGLPLRTGRAPRLTRGPIRGWRLRTRPFPVRLDDVEAAQPADPLIALLHFTTHVPRAAADPPLVHAGITAERPPRTGHRSLAPPAHRFPRLVSLRDTPLIRRHDPRPLGTHASHYRCKTTRSLRRAAVNLERPQTHHRIHASLRVGISALSTSACRRGRCQTGSREHRRTRGTSRRSRSSAVAGR